MHPNPPTPAPPTDTSTYKVHTMVKLFLVAFVMIGALVCSTFIPGAWSHFNVGGHGIPYAAPGLALVLYVAWKAIK